MAPRNLVITSLRGGLNDTDPAHLISDDQCVEALNVEWTRSMLGERRRGTSAPDIAGSGLVGRDRVPFIFRHLPTSDETAAELWALGVTGTSSSALVRKTTSWSTVVPVDAITITGTYQYDLTAHSLHGKLFICYKSGQDRLHVWDGTTLRRTGLAEPAAPVVTNNAAGGAYTGTRYFRVRYVVMSGSTVLRRSEPSDATTFNPSGVNAGVDIAKPASISESETHWEIEASTDNANFYRISRQAVGTVSYTDTTSFATGYANVSGAVLSADIGDYSLIHSGRYLAADGDRLLIGGSFENEALASRVSWTPVFGDTTGDGNDERLETDNDPFVDLDSLDGGPITGLIAGTIGSVYAFKRSHIYKLVRTGDRNKAYRATLESKSRGALPGSIVQGVDQTGEAAIYFLDPDVGPCRISQFGIQSCGADISQTWATVNKDAAQVVARGLFYPAAKQIHFFVSTTAQPIPNKRLVLQTNEQRNTENGARRGWSIWDGLAAQALSCCLFSSNIDDNAARNRYLVPFLGMQGNGLLQMTDESDEDGGTAFDASIKTKHFAPAGMLNRFGVMSGVVVLREDPSITITITLSGDFGLLTDASQTIDALEGASIPYAIRTIDDIGLQEIRTVQVQFDDTFPAGARWELAEFSPRLTGGQTA